MARSPVDLGREPGMLLDITSYVHRGPTRRDRLSPQELAVLTRTARRTPEVVVKVSGGAKTGPGVLAHLQYIDRNGRLEIETDQGEILQGNVPRRRWWTIGNSICLPRNPAHPTGAFPAANRENSFTTWCCRCRRARRPQNSWQRAESLPERNSHSSIAMRSFCIPIRITRTSIL
jgi:hypothetical protein